MQTNPEQYLSIGDASEYLGVSIDTLRRWTRKGKILSYRSPGKHRYFKTTDLDQVFGTRYEREEKDDHKSPEPSLHNIEHLDHVEAPIEEVKEEAPPLVVETPKEEKKPLEVPRYIKHQNISKYDLLFAPNIADEITDKVAEEIKPVVTENLDFHPILIPSTHRPPRETVKVTSDIKDVEPEQKVSIESVIEKSTESPKDYGKIERILSRAFLIFLIVDLILFFFWFTTNRLNSPIS